ncbi:MAG TPA: VWA domain-containing protein [Thermoanaerobaculia bacterium]|nr:VWA domain-containing protein [Thermoanaerobaculia bacterium]
MATLRMRALWVVAAALIGAGLAVPARAQQCGPMDVTFIIDNSGSMTNVIHEVQTQVSKIADAVQTASGGDYQFGLVAMPANDVAVLLDMSANNRAALDTAVQQMKTTSSCGAGIAYDEALDTVINHLGPRNGSVGSQTGSFNGQWRSNAAKIIILITDTGPQGFDCVAADHAANAHDQAVAAAAADIHITGIFVPTGGGTDPTVDIPVMQDVVATSGGLSEESKANASDLADVIVTIVNACGGAGGAGSQFLVLDPHEVLLENLDHADINTTLFLPAKGTEQTVYTASGLPADSTVQFLPRTPDVDLTEARTMRVTIGPDTPAGTYILTVKASRSDMADQFDYVLVIVDCQPPFILGVNDLGTQSQSVTSGQSATLTATPGGNGPFHYQWYSGHSGITSSPISGATSSTLKTPAITAPSEFWVRITNACGTRDSATATVSPR